MKLFRPHRIVSNTLDPGMANLDWIAIDNMFKDCLSYSWIRGPNLQMVGGKET